MESILQAFEPLWGPEHGMPTEPTEASEAFAEDYALREVVPKQGESAVQAFEPLWGSEHGMPSEPTEASEAFAEDCALREVVPKQAESGVQAFHLLRRVAAFVPAKRGNII